LSELGFHLQPALRRGSLRSFDLAGGAAILVGALSGREPSRAAAPIVGTVRRVWSCEVAYTRIEPIRPTNLLPSADGTKFMIMQRILAAAILSMSTLALAQEQGTPEQRAACAPDVRRFCHHLKESDGPDAFLQCFELHRDDLSKKCSDMLKNYGK
jgi:hypothetical protein